MTDVTDDDDQPEWMRGRHVLMESLSCFRHAPHRLTMRMRERERERGKGEEERKKSQEYEGETDTCILLLLVTVQANLWACVHG